MVSFYLSSHHILSANIFSPQHSATEHRERKDLHLYLVLVSDSARNALRTRHLSSAHHLCAISSSTSAQRQKSHGATRDRRVGVE